MKLTDMLSREGIYALRFDFRGYGDSEGEFTDITFEEEISDSIKALDFLSTIEGVDPDRMGILGLSMGGAVAAYVAGRDARVKSTVLWSAPAVP